MSGILNGNRNDNQADACGAKSLYVRGFPYSNTASKFWTCLLDEVAADYPPETRLELAAMSGGLLTPDLLTPEASLRRDMEKLGDKNVQEAFSDAIAALEVIGPPPIVTLRLMPPEGQGAPAALPLEYLDAEILPFLMAWLLEWSAVPDLMWNKESIRGAFAAQDRDRTLVYRVAFEMTSHHLSEGLYERKVQIGFKRETG